MASKKQKISIQYQQSRSSDQPLLVSFPSTVSPFTLSNVKDISFSLFDTAEGVVLSASHEGDKSTNFSSKPGRDSANQESLETKYLVGVFDKNKQTLQLVETPSLFKLLPKYSHLSNAEEISSSAVTSENYAAKRKGLTEQFGTKMSKKLLSDPTNLKNLDKLQITDDVFNSEAAHKTAHLLQEKESSGESERLEILPPFNLKAKKSREVFPLETFIPQDIEEELQAGSQVLTQAIGNAKSIDTLRKSQTWPAIVLNLIEHAFPNNLFGTPPSKAPERLLYLTYLMRFYGKIQRRFQRKSFVQDATDYGIPHLLFTRFISMFCVPSLLSPDTFASTEKLTLKLLNYILIAALWSNNFVTDVHLLSLDLNYEMPKLMRHVKFIGLTPFALEAPNPHFSNELFCLQCPVKFANMFERGFGKRKRP